MGANQQYYNGLKYVANFQNFVAKDLLLQALTYIYMPSLYRCQIT